MQPPRLLGHTAMTLQRTWNESPDVRIEENSGVQNDEVSVGFVSSERSYISNGRDQCATIELRSGRVTFRLEGWAPTH